MSPVRAVLVDLYDTLVWSEWPALRGEIEERLGISEADLIRAFVTTRPARSIGTYDDAEGDLRAVLQAAGAEPDPALVRELLGGMGAFLQTGVTLWDDSMPVLRELRERGIKTALVSNCDHSTRAVVERLGLVEATDATILSFEVGAAKPDPAIYLAALDALGARPAESLFVDDQAAYCDGAAVLGIEALLIHRDDAHPDEGFGEPGAHRVIPDLRSVLDLV